MISILIPIYNRNATKLVDDLRKQLEETGVLYEIVAFDDGSEEKTLLENAALGQKKGIRYEICGVNRGRSIIRNQLAKAAKYETLLFLDCDSEIDNPSFIATYLKHIDSDVVYGGTHYIPSENVRERALHLKFGLFREALTAERRKKAPWLTFKTNNFMIKSSIIKKVRFDEEIKAYGYEDVVFAEALKAQGIIVNHIDNAVIHRGLENNTSFLNKTEVSIENLVELIKKGKIKATRLSEFYQKLGWIFKILEGINILNPLEKRIYQLLAQGSWGLWLFDVWKLMVFHQKLKSLPKIR